MDEKYSWMEIRTGLPRGTLGGDFCSIRGQDFSACDRLGQERWATLFKFLNENRHCVNERGMNERGVVVVVVVVDSNPKRLRSRPREARIS